MTLYYTEGNLPEPLPRTLYVEGRAVTGPNRLAYLQYFGYTEAPDKPSPNAQWTGSDWSSPPAYDSESQHPPVWNGSEWEVRQKTFDERFPTYTTYHKNFVRKNRIRKLLREGDRIGALEEKVRDI